MEKKNKQDKMVLLKDGKATCPFCGHEASLVFRHEILTIDHKQSCKHANVVTNANYIGDPKIAVWFYEFMESEADV